MFDGIIVYKQWHRRLGRWCAYLYNPTTKCRTTMSWARYIMLLHLGRLLDPNTETVDHINNDKTDDRIENLQLLTRKENNSKASKGRTMETLKCIKCSKNFKVEKWRVKHIKGYCSISCSSKKRNN